MVTNNPLVSVIIPVYNKRKFIKATIDSVINQSYQNFEIIVVDDGSTDNSMDIVNSLNDSRLRVFSQPNSGVERARNNGFYNSVGSFITFQDADDLMSQDRLKKQIDFFVSNEALVLVGTWANVIDVSGNVIGSICPPISNDALRLAHIFRNQFVSSSVMIRRSAINPHLVFNETRNPYFSEDYDLWLRLTGEGTVANIPEKLTSYRRLESSRSQDDRGSLTKSARQISAEWLVKNSQHFTSLEAANSFVSSINGLDDLTVNDRGSLINSRETYRKLLGELGFNEKRTRFTELHSVIIRHKLHILIWSLLGKFPIRFQKIFLSLLSGIKSARSIRYIWERSHLWLSVLKSNFKS